MQSYYSRPGSKYKSQGASFTTTPAESGFTNANFSADTAEKGIYDPKRTTAAALEGGGKGALTAVGMAAPVASASIGTALVGGAGLVAATGGVALPLLAVAGAGALVGAAIRRGKERKAQRAEFKAEQQQEKLDKKQAALAKDAAYDQEQMAAEMQASQQLGKTGMGTPVSEEDRLLAGNMYGAPASGYDAWRKKVYG